MARALNVLIKPSLSGSRLTGAKIQLKFITIQLFIRRLYHVSFPEENIFIDASSLINNTPFFSINNSADNSSIKEDKEMR